MRAFGEIKSKLNDAREPLMESGAVIQRSMADQFLSEGERYGEPWTPLSQATIRRREAKGFGAIRRKERLKKREERAGFIGFGAILEDGDLGTMQIPILRDTGRLFGSIRIRHSTQHYIKIGTNLIYANTHEYGDDSRNIPARPFLAVDESGEFRNVEDENKISQIFDIWVQKKLDEVG